MAEPYASTLILVSEMPANLEHCWSDADSSLSLLGSVLKICVEMN